MRMRALLGSLLLCVACEPRVSAVAPVQRSGQIAQHPNDPEVPLVLSVTSRMVGDEVEVAVRVVPGVSFPTMTLGVDISQSFAVSNSESQRVFHDVAQNVAVTHTVLLRRVVPITSGITVRAWVEARVQSSRFGDERAITIFGVAPVSQPNPGERLVVTPTGQQLHDTVIH
jgi:hypothetical protein